MNRIIHVMAECDLLQPRLLAMRFKARGADWSTVAEFSPGGVQKRAAYMVYSTRNFRPSDSHTSNRLVVFTPPPIEHDRIESKTHRGVFRTRVRR